ncbi:gliding motility-associated ABC transporter substrate-binding protein GldG [Flavisolibacter tropicus]|nr:gliding motility-associated ABC transporter substrate-binding protein GldG [Flavisolibacter tropicus]
MKGKKTNNRLWWIGIAGALALINVLAAQFHQRFDLTEEKRFSLSKPTKDLLRQLEAPVTIDVYLTGKELPAVVRKFRNTLSDFLFETKQYAGNNLQFNFIDPYASNDTAVVRQLQDSLATNYGLTPVVINAPAAVGDELKIKQLIHGAVVRYGDRSVGVDLLQGEKSFGTEKEQLAALYNNMEARIEYKFASAIQKITTKQKPVVAYALGHGETFDARVNDAFITIRENYSGDTINIKEVPFIPSQINALVILKPTQPFADADKLKIDQYVMNGGKVFWMIDNMYAEFDSLYKSNGFIAYDRGLNLEDLLFTYGVRINQTLLQDMQCDKLPQVGPNGQQMLVDWPFFPILNGTDHPISKNLDGIRSMFPTTLDTVQAAGIRKTVLLQSSNNSRYLEAPAKIDFEFLQIAPDQKLFHKPATPVAYLLEGKFRSLYTGRVPRAVADSLKQMNHPFQNTAVTDGKMIVVADGDIAMNQFSSSAGPLPMGMNVFTRYTFANKDFFVNSLEYLVNPTDILQTRSKEYTLRLLDPRRVDEQRSTWQLVNIALPIVLVVLFGYIYQQVRKRTYTVGNPKN